MLRDTLKIIKKVSVTLCMTLTFIACSELNEIPDNELESIITESLIRQSIINNYLDSHRNVNFDTLQTHQDILDRYGYSLKDFKYTVDVMTRRKSNPLDNILGRVVRNIELEADVAQRRYQWLKHTENMALDYYRDTIYSHTERIGKDFEEYRAEVLGLEVGDYEIMINYQAMADYKYPQKSLRHYTTQEGVKHKNPNILWLTRSSMPRTNITKFSLDEYTDSLLIFIHQTQPARATKKEIRRLKKTDTSYVSSIKVIYTPKKTKAARDFYNLIYLNDITPFALKKERGEQFDKFKKQPYGYLKADSFEFKPKDKNEQENISIFDITPKAGTM